MSARLHELLLTRAPLLPLPVPPPAPMPMDYTVAAIMRQPEFFGATVEELAVLKQAQGILTSLVTIRNLNTQKTSWMFQQLSKT